MSIHGKIFYTNVIFLAFFVKIYVYSFIYLYLCYIQIKVLNTPKDLLANLSLSLPMRHIHFHKIYLICCVLCILLMHITAPLNHHRYIYIHIYYAILNVLLFAVFFHICTYKKRPTRGLCRIK